MLEIDVKHRVCPFIQQYGVAEVGQKEFTESSNIHCLGSKCMAWKWEGVYAKPQGPLGHARFLRSSTTDGHCERLR